MDGVLYFTVLTLIIFLLFRIPKIWEKVDFTKANRKDSNIAGGATAIISSILCLTVHYLVAPTHIINGINYGDAFHITAAVIGWGMLAVGAFVIIRSALYHLRASSRSPHDRSAETCLPACSLLLDSRTW